MGDLGNKQRSGTQRIVGSDEKFAADVKQYKDSVRKLAVSDLDTKDLLYDLCFKLDSLHELLRFSPNKQILEDGYGTGFKAKINSLGVLKVNSQNTPDPIDPILDVPLSGYLTDVNGNIDARVNGSVAPIDFYIAADQDQDTYINSISLKIADQNAQLNNFGNIPALPVGFDLIYKTQELGERLLATTIRSNFDIIRLCQGLPAFSQGVESFRASNVIGGAEGYIPVLRITDNFGLPYGLRLRGGTTDRLIWRINDDVSGVDAFDIFYYGLQKV